MSTTSFESACLPVELRNKYAVSRTLGTGACGEVKLVFSKTKFQRFAMKTISRSRNTYYNNSNESEKILNEVRILNSLKHVSELRKIFFEEGNIDNREINLSAFHH